MKRSDLRRRRRSTGPRRTFESLESRLMMDGAGGDLSFVRFDDAQQLRDQIIARAADRYDGLFGSQEYYFWRPELSNRDANLQLAAVSSPAATSDSGTNVQVQGVDEGDLVKTDGDYLYWSRQDGVRIIDVRDPTRMTEVGRLPVDPTGAYAFQPTEMYVVGDRLVTVAPTSGPVFDVFGGGAAFRSMAADFVPWKPAFSVQVFDVSDRAAPTLLRRFEFDGSYSSSRLVDGQLLVTTAPTDVLPLGNQCQSEQTNVGALQATSAGILPMASVELIAAPLPYNSHCRFETRDEYVARLKQGDLESLLPSFVTRDAEGVRIADDAFDVGDFAFTSRGGWDNTLLVATIDLGAAAPRIADVEILAGKLDGFFSGDVYFNGEHLYVFGNQWGGDERTTIHRFDVAADGQVAVVGSGVVGGVVLDQFGLDEHDGYLRVATRIGSFWDENANSRLSVLELQGERLVTVGQLDDIGAGETLESVRFAGDVAYAVTFFRDPTIWMLNRDPLFTIDLSNPLAPRKLGELEMPGYSSYLQLLGDGVLLGLGWDTDEMGVATSPKLSLCDTSDLHEPRLLQNFMISAGSSEALWNHHAVTWLPDRQLLALPVELPAATPTETVFPSIARPWFWPTTQSQLMLFRIDPTAEQPIQLAGQVDDMGVVRRSVQIGDTLIAVGDDTLTAVDLDDPTRQIGSLYIGPRVYPDFVHATAGSGPMVVPVLMNDRVAATARIESVDAPNIVGQVTISEDGRYLIYTPPAAAVREPGMFWIDWSTYDQFSYTVLDADGSRFTSQATVTIFEPWNPPDGDDGGSGGGGSGGGGSDGGGATNIVSEFRLQAVDADGNVLEQVRPGDTFYLDVYVADLRETPQGVFGAYLDIGYDAEVVRLADGGVEHGSQYQNVVSADLATPGRVDELGGVSIETTPPGGGEVLLARLTFVAQTAGAFSFTADQADLLPDHELLLFGDNSPIAASRQQFVAPYLVVAAEYTNAQQPLDASGDGVVAPDDALFIINELNSRGPGRIGERMTSLLALAATGEPMQWLDRARLDINGDGHLSPLDALMIVNFLNGSSTAPDDGAEGESSTTASHAAAVDDFFARLE